MPQSSMPQPTKEIKMKPHAHDSFEVDIDIDDLDIKSDISDLFGDDEPATKELSAFTPPPEEPTTQEIVDLSLPATSNEQALPFYVPVSKATPSPLPRKKMTPLTTPRPQPSGPDFSELFDDHVQEGSISKESPPVHDLSDLQDSESSPGEGLPMFAPSIKSTPSKSDSEPSGPRFGKGFTAGMAPLDITEFADEAPRKKKKLLSGGGRPAPMAGSKKVVRRRFIFTITVRDIILFLLVLVLAAALWVGWTIYQEYRTDKALASVKSGQELIDATKDEAIKKQENKLEKDIP